MKSRWTSDEINSRRTPWRAKTADSRKRKHKAKHHTEQIGYPAKLRVHQSRHWANESNSRNVIYLTEWKERVCLWSDGAENKGIFKLKRTGEKVFFNRDDPTQFSRLGIFELDQVCTSLFLSAFTGYSWKPCWHPIYPNLHVWRVAFPPGS